MEGEGRGRAGRQGLTVAKQVEAIATLGTTNSFRLQQSLQAYDCTRAPDYSGERDVTLQVGATHPLTLRVSIQGRAPAGCVEAFEGFKVRTSTTVAFGGLSEITDLQGNPVSGIHLIAEDGTDYTDGIPLPPGCANSFDDDMNGGVDLPADGAYKSAADNSERSSCGLGAEIAGVLGVLHLARRRTSRKSRSV